MTRCLAILGKIEIDVPTPRFGSTDILEVGEDPFVSISGWKEWGANNNQDKLVYVSASESEDEGIEASRLFLQNYRANVREKASFQQSSTHSLNSKPEVIETIRPPAVSPELLRRRPAIKVPDLLRSASAPVSSTKSSTITRESPIPLPHQQFAAGKKDTPLGNAAPFVEHTPQIVRDLPPLRSFSSPPSTQQPVKKSSKMPSTSTLGKRKRIEMKPEKDQIFKDLKFCYLPDNDICKTRRFRIELAQSYGATWVKEFSPEVTHIIVDNNKLYDYEWVAKYLKLSSRPENVIVVNDEFQVQCIKQKKIQDHNRGIFLIPGWEETEETTETEAVEISSVEISSIDDAIRETKKLDRFLPGLSDDDVGEEDDSLSTTAVPEEEDTYDERHSSPEPEHKPKASRSRKYSSDASWQKELPCMKGGNGERVTGPNSHTINILQQMATYYDNTNEIWKVRAYRRAISVLGNQAIKVTTFKQARSLPGIGDRLALKIEEIAQTKGLRRLENAKLDPTDITFSKFMNIYGVGKTIATKWVAQGYKSLDDLLTKANLTPNQRVGIERYDDFLIKIPREEVTQLGDIIKRTVKEIDPDINIIIGGSYRRRDKESGDIDLIVTKPGAGLIELNPLLHEIVSILTSKKFLIAPLAVSRSEDGSKWQGCCVLPGQEKPIWRRIDFLLVPDAEIGAALIYFTGNDTFNRSIRLLASKKGMRLNEHGLYKDVFRGENRQKMNDGDLVEGRDEKNIFAALGVPWREPEDRNC